jgi:hypothetical protein
MSSTQALVFASKVPPVDVAASSRQGMNADLCDAFLGHFIAPRLLCHPPQLLHLSPPLIVIFHVRFALFSFQAHLVQACQAVQHVFLFW